MNIELPEEQRLLRESVLKLLAESHPVGRSPSAGPDPGHADFWSRIAGLGWLKLALPETAGGYGGAWSDLALIAEALGRHLVVSPFVPAIGFCAAALAGSGRHAEVLTALGEGKLLMVPAITGTGALGFPGHLAAGGGAGAPRLEGRARAVSFADVADQVLVASRAAGSSDPRLWLLERGRSGQAATPYRLMDGTPAADLAFSGVAVAEADGAGGATDFARALDTAAALTAAEMVGAMWTLQELTLSYLKIRKQFGVVLSTLQALQHRLVDMYVLCQSAESAMLDAVSALDRDDAVDRAFRVSRARAHVDRAARRVAEEAIQLHGGIAMTADYPVGAYMKRITVLRTSFGDERWHRERVRVMSRERAPV